MVLFLKNINNFHESSGHDHFNVDRYMLLDDVCM